MTPAGEHLLGMAERMLPEFEHGEKVLADMAQGRRGLLRIGMECHPCQEWLLRIVSPYLAQWPDVDIRLCSDFRFDGIAALLDYQIDLLITPDPINTPDLQFTQAFEYELMVAMHMDHRLAEKEFMRAEDFIDEALMTVPVSVDRLDVFTRFLLPARCRPKDHVTAESVEMMLQLVATGRCITVLPDWFLHDATARMPIRTLRIGPEGLYKSINLGVRSGEDQIEYMAGFYQLAQSTDP